MCCCARLKAAVKLAMAAAVVVAIFLLNAVWPAAMLDQSAASSRLHGGPMPLHQETLLPWMEGEKGAETAALLEQLRQSLDDAKRQQARASADAAARRPPLPPVIAPPAASPSSSSRLRKPGRGGAGSGPPSSPQQQQQKQTQAGPPHILFVLADDLGNDDLSLTQPLLETPVLHGLASRGVFLQNYYSQSLCSPSRAALNTGRYPARFGMQSYVLLDEQRYGMDLGEATLPQLLQRQHGYRTHLIGKWHLGYHSWRRTPTFRGYDSFHGYVVVVRRS